MLDVLILIIGLALIILGANYLVDGASNIAKRAGISDFIIGMTIVGMGTSAPEFVVSLLGALSGNGDIAVGNVIGSNIFNILIILGITAMITPLPLTTNNIKKDIPFGLLAATALIVALSDIFLDKSAADVVSRSEGILLLLFFAVFIAYTIYSSSGEGKLSDPPGTEKSEEGKRGKRSVTLSILMVIGGLAGLVFGGNLFVDSATNIAKMLGVSDAVIAVTILAGGTSLPELASCIVAAYKKNTDLALGNVIGSNVFNIFLILGCSATISPLGPGDITYTHLAALFISSFALFLTAFTFRKKELDRVEGLIFVLLYIAYIFLILK